ncbi:hypothetical protein X771_32750 [Mesorhizobium sp. LSJC277A00]|nr:hypothetical protein X771_32750 [Mesorhizobium sp. LSJC277A00]
MLGNRPVGGKGAFDNRTQMVGVEMFYWRIAPSQRVGRFDLLRRKRSISLAFFRCVASSSHSIVPSSRRAA